MSETVENQVSFMQGHTFLQNQEKQMNRTSSQAVIPDHYFKYKPAKGQQELNAQKKREVLQLKDLLPEPRKKTKEETLAMIKNYKVIMKGQQWKKEMFELNARPAALKSELSQLGSRERMASAEATSIQEVSTAQKSRFFSPKDQSPQMEAIFMPHIEDQTHASRVIDPKRQLLLEELKRRNRPKMQKISTQELLLDYIGKPKKEMLKRKDKFDAIALEKARIAKKTTHSISKVDQQKVLDDRGNIKNRILDIRSTINKIGENLL